MLPRQVLAQQNDLTVIDVRTHHEWADGHIDGARHIPMAEVPARLGEVERDRPVVTVCQSGHRSGQVAEYLAQQGFTVHNMAGGMTAWERDGLPVHRSRPQPGAGSGPRWWPRRHPGGGA